MSLIQAHHDKSVSRYRSLREELRLVKSDISASAKEHSETVAATTASFKAIGERAFSFARESEETNTRAVGDVADASEVLVASAKAVVARAGSHREEVDTFVSEGQDSERTRYNAMEKEFRMRSDKAPDQLRDIQELTRVRNSMAWEVCFISTSHLSS